MTPTDTVLEALRAHGQTVQQAGNHWRATCPTHEDRQPSLSITEGNEGRALLNCHAGCETAQIIKELGLELTDLFPPKQPADKPARMVDAYNYTDADGETIYQVCRYEPKTFRQRRPDGKGGWVWTLGDVARVPYNLPAILNAASTDLILICEGEKDADAASMIPGTIGTTWAGGAGTTPTMLEVFAGHSVAVVADLDKPGIKHARNMVAELAREGVEADLVRPIAGKDLADHLGAGYTLDDLAPLEAEDVAEQIEIDETPEPPERLASLLTNLHVGKAALSIPKPEPLIEGLLDLDSLAFIYGPPGAGKSFIALDMALSVALGHHWYGRRAVATGPVLYIAGEGVAGLGVRIRAWLAEHTGELTDNFQLLAAAPLIHQREDAEALIALCAQIRPHLVVLDTMARVTAGAEENSAKEMGQAIQTLDAIKDGPSHPCVMGVHHSGKDVTQGMRGSSALLGAADTTLQVLPGDRSLTLTPDKQRHHETGDTLRWKMKPVGDSIVLADNYGVDELKTTPDDLMLLRQLNRESTRGGISRGDLTALTEQSEDRVFRIIHKLIDLQLIEKRNGRGTAVIYQITPAGQAELDQ